jgi:ABC-2 type transport system ATP-binding protein
MNAIKTENITKKYGDLIAVDNISLSIKKGEIFGLLGPNGAGKTTMNKMLATLLKPASGLAEVWDYNVLSEQDAVRKSIGIVFQNPSLDIELTGRENLNFHARIYNISKDVRQKRIDEVLHLVELRNKADIFVKNYSGGMQRRLEIARGLMHYPNVLFLDEPTLGLDAQTRLFAFPVFLLSGAFFPLEKLPVWLQYLTYINTYGVDGLRYCLIGITQFSVTLNILVLVFFVLS